ncbi:MULTISPECIES: FkbM family methyltransferase [unclassified Pantoea]|uniref:FkbM family methyltransferase n=1 Tax=unclassified Pantoea TaxID=2630326 RepID=UPI00301E516C
MSIVSYAQNFEDVMLWRALGNITNGFYVDIGANDPIIDSVTNLFYQNGWSGINVEPLKSHYNALIESRNRDINLNLAVSDRIEELNIWESEIRGWATLDEKVAEQHELNGFKGEWSKTSTKTLSYIFEKHLSSDNKEIHFLKIDVEGVEEAVVRSNDWKRYRPWILVIESTAPNSKMESHEQWDDILKNNDYIFLYFDGLNRFYVSKEHEDLAVHFQTPPNIFDEFISSAEENYRKMTISLNEKIIALNSEVEGYKRAIDGLNDRIYTANNRLNEVYSSNSWKMTMPIRKVSSFFKKES